MASFKKSATKMATVAFLITIASMGCAVARKSNSISSKDILEWTDRHAVKARLLNKRLHTGPVSLNDLKSEVLVTDPEAHTSHTRTCAHRAMSECDLKSMASLLMVDDSPCTLLKEYRVCIEHQTRRCGASGNAALLTSAFNKIAAGLQANGHCANIVAHNGPTNDQPARPCSRRGTWLCTTAFVEDLKENGRSPCQALTSYRHCLHEQTSHCGSDSQTFLRGVQGLSRLYRRLTRRC